MDRSRASLARIGDAKYLSLHRGSAGHFAVVHHYDDDRLAITVHSFDVPGTILSRVVISGSSRRFEGPFEPWLNVPTYYVAYLVQPTWSDFTLVCIGREEPSLQTFDWFDDSYDKAYQGVFGVTEIPNSGHLLVSVQRSSRLILYDPVARKKRGEVSLAGGHGSPSLFFRSQAAELWADDYDTVVKLEANTWRALQRRKLQDAAFGEARFIGQFSFDATESLCAVARPFSGDIVGIDPDTMRTTYRAKVGGQPLKVALLRDHRVFARDWKTGNLLTAELICA
ncbi:MAG: hypothetical protein U1E83_02185 [Methylotetracoccus sp.]